MEKTAEVLCSERLQRIEDAYDMKQPDRVPISMNLGYMIARLEGVTNEYLYDNPDKTQEFVEKWAVHFQPDMISGGGWPRNPSTLIGDKQTAWPGGKLPPDRPFQFLDGEYMKPEEYDDLLTDPSDFVVRKFMPRIFGELEGFAMLPPLPLMMHGYTTLSSLAVVGAPPMVKALEALSKVAQEYAESGKRNRENSQKMAELGFPTRANFAGLFMCPFDLIGDTMRGTRGIMRDMYQRPEKLKAAMEIGRRIVVEAAQGIAQVTGGTDVILVLHKGSDGFMSLDQFEEFYWPGLKGVMMDLIEVGLKPVPFYEGVWDQRLKYLAELPKGKTRGMFERSDMGKVKEVLGDVMAIQGGFPVSLLQGGTEEQIREHTKWMCEVVGEGGGFVMGASTAMDYAKPELVKIWVDATKEYGVY